MAIDAREFDRVHEARRSAECPVTKAGMPWDAQWPMCDRPMASPVFPLYRLPGPQCVAGSVSGETIEAAVDQELQGVGMLSGMFAGCGRRRAA